MLNYNLSKDQGVLTLQPAIPMAARDFAQLSETINRYLNSHERLHGLIIHADHAWDWEDFSILLDHLWQDNQIPVDKLATVTDQPLNEIIESLRHHFASAELKRFDGQHLDDAMGWASH